MYYPVRLEALTPADLHPVGKPTLLEAKYLRLYCTWLQKGGGWVSLLDGGGGGMAQQHRVSELPSLMFS